MAKLKITKKSVDALPIPDKEKVKGVKYYDSELHGFGLVVYPSCRKSFFIEYGPTQRRRRMVLGQYGKLTVSEARKKAQLQLASVLDGDDPLDKKQKLRDELTFEKWSDDYLDDVKDFKKRLTDDIRYLKIAKDKWKNRSLESISIDDISQIFHGIGASGKTTSANRWLASVRACLQAAWRKGKIVHNPAMRVKPFPENPAKRRTLSDKEFKKLYEAIMEIKDPYVKTAFIMLVETGARLSEVLHARWEDFDFAEPYWRIPTTKSGTAQMMPISSVVVDALTSIEKVSEYIIRGRYPETQRRDLKRPWKNLQEATKLKDVTIHDLRRTFGLHVTKTAGLHMASKLLRHSDIRVTEKHYAPLSMDDMRVALGKRSKVVKRIKSSKENE